MGRPIVLLAALACVWTSACSPRGEVTRDRSGEPRQGGVLRLVQEAPSTLDPLHADSVYESLPMNQIFDGLVALSPSLNVVPAIAETWTVCQAGTTYDFHLRPDVRFHDGTELTVEDVAYSIRRLLAPDAHRGLAFSYLTSIEGALDYASGKAETLTGVEVVDEDTIEIRLERPYPSFLEVLAMSDVSIVPRRAIEGRAAEFARSPVGTGPFRVDVWNDDMLRLTANRDYFGGAPFLDAVEIHFPTGDETNRARDLRAGSYDVIEPATGAMGSLESDPGVRVLRYQELSVAFLGLNADHPPLDQPWMRQAIAHAIDREALVAESPTVRRMATGVLPPGISGYSPEEKGLSHDPERARSLLADAGHADGAGLPPVELWAPQSSLAVRNVTEGIRRDLESVGIVLKVRDVSWAELDAGLNDRTAPAFLLGWVADLTDPDSFMRSLFESAGSGNYFSYSDSRTDEMLSRGSVTKHPLERARLYRGLERRVLGEAPMVPLYHTLGVIAMRDGVEGLAPGPLGMAHVEFERVWLREPAGRKGELVSATDRPQLERSFAVSSALLVLVFLVAILGLGHFNLANRLERSVEARALSVAESIGAVATPSLLAYNYGALQVAAEGAAERDDIVYVVIHDKEGRIAGISGAERESIETPDASVAGGASSLRRRLESEGMKSLSVLEVTTPVHVEGATEPWGTVRVAMDYGLVTAELRQLAIGLILLGIAISICAVVVSRWMARRIAAPLKRLAEATEALAHGEMSHRIPLTGARELAELADAFNVMIDRVQEKAAESEAYQEKLAQLNATLEQSVRERTRALAESERQYRTLVEHSPESILIVQQWQVRFVNASFLDTFGLTEAEVLDPEFRLDSVFDESSAAAVRRQIEAWLADKSPAPAELTALDHTGRTRLLELRGSRISYLGEPAAECLLVDMTEARRLRDQLEDTERLRALGELSSGVAHDFNNLLGAILGRTQLLLCKQLDDKIEADLQVIEKAALDGRETVLRIQEFSRTRTDRPMERIKLHEIVADSLEMTRSLWSSDAARRNVTIQVDALLADVPAILGNPTELREVFTNLILNAVDAMPDGGELRLTTTRDGEVVRATVEDSGAGMTDEAQRRMFDPFFSTKGVGGLGLGLSVAYGIVKRHLGKLEVVSQVGCGTRLTVEFPLTPMPALADPDRAACSAAKSAGPARILVIDDEESIAELLRDTLKLDGHQVDTASGGQEGIDLARAGGYDIVLTDLGMPDVTGWDVARTLRQELSRLPIVLVTGWGTTLTEEEIAEAGVAAVVHKPFELKPLLATVSAVLEQSVEA